MKKKVTKRTLLSSLLSILLCVSMLLGATFAWFTDSVTSGNNNIVAGNLDVELYNDTTVNEAKKVGPQTALFEEVSLWEPGGAAYENLTVANVGTLALSYELSVNFLNENATQDGYKLSDILKVAFVENGVSGTRDEVIAAAQEAGFAPLKSWEQTGSLYPVGNRENHASTATYGVVIYWEPSAGDNNWNLNNGKSTTDGEPYLHIDLGVNLVASQLPYESDSFGNQYDVDARYAVDDAEDLAAALNAGKPVALAADIDLTGEEAFPIANYTGTLDGNGHTLSGLSTNLFTSITGATIANVNFVADIDTGNTTDEIAVIAEHAYGDVAIDNVSVSGEVEVYQGSAFIRKVETGHTVITNSENNAAVTSYAQKAAGFICTVGEGDVTIRDCVNNGNVTANAARAASSEVYAGGFLAWNSNGNGTTVTLENCVNNGDITGIRTVSGSSTVAAGGISAIAWGISGSFTTNLTGVTNNGAVVAENADAGHNAHAGGIIGMVNPGAVVNINTAASNGSVTAKITNGANTTGVGNAGGVIGQLNNGRVSMVQISIGKDAVISAQTNAASDNVGALVGNATGNTGSVSVAYDTETVTYSGSLPYIGNIAASVAVTEVPSTAAELESALGANQSVVLAGDMDLSGWTAVGTQAAPFTGSFNGNGYTISGLSGSEGLFGYVSGATIENVVLNVAMDGGPALAYEVLGGAAAPTVISGVTVNGTVQNAPAAMMRNARTTSDGSEGTRTDTEITIVGCTNNADVTAENINRATAFVSTVFGAVMRIDSCVNNGDMTVVSDTEAHAAGIAGYIMRNTDATMPSLTVTGCVNNGNVSGKSTSDGRSNVGGIIATAHQGTTVIENCINNGNVSGEDATDKNQACVGGIVGRVNSTAQINGCTNTGSVTATALNERAYAGGIVGMCDKAALTIDAATTYTGVVTSNGTPVNKPVGNMD